MQQAASPRACSRISVGHRTYVTMYGMRRTTVYLPDDLDSGDPRLAERVDDELAAGFGG